MILIELVIPPMFDNIAMKTITTRGTINVNWIESVMIDALIPPYAVYIAVKPPITIAVIIRGTSEISFNADEIAVNSAVRNTNK